MSGRPETVVILYAGSGEPIVPIVTFPASSTVSRRNTGTVSSHALLFHTFREEEDSAGDNCLAQPHVSVHVARDVGGLVPDRLVCGCDGVSA